MAQWKETLEPYIKVNERIRTTTIVPTAGEDLIIGATIISDSGPSYPVLITSQREFLNTFASQEITKGYIESLNDFYEDPDDESPDKLASTMWLNAYRLAGSTNMLIVRATKGADMNYVKPLGVDQSTNDTFIVRDGQLLKKVHDFYLTIDRIGTSSTRKESGWAISINEIGIIGNLVGDEGPVYEYFASDLRELVEYLNGTSKFFSPDYEFLKWNAGGTALEDAGTENPSSIHFKEVYLAQNFLLKSGFGTIEGNASWGNGQAGSSIDSEEIAYGTKADGLAYLLASSEPLTPTASGENAPRGDLRGPISTTTNLIDLNSTDYSGWEGNPVGYVVNTYNSNSPIKIRIRKFNHDAVILADTAPTIEKNEKSPYIPINEVIEQFESPTITPDQRKRIEERDFFEVAVLDPSLDKDPLSFCVGNIPGRGDITLDELNDTLKMININIDSLSKLGLSYYKSGNIDDNSEDDAGGWWEEAVGSSLPDLPQGSVPVFRAMNFINTTGLRDNSYFIIDSSTKGKKFVSSTINVSNNIPKLGDSRIVTDSSEGLLNLMSELNVDYPNANLTYNGTLTDGADEYITSEVNGMLRSGQFGDDLPASGPIAFPISGNNYTFESGMGLTREGGNNGNNPQLFIFHTAPQVYIDLSINTDETKLLTVTPGDLTRSISSITEDEVYTTEGLTDLGNTNLKFQTYLCNMAKNENYFYPISTLYSTNYLAIANYRSRLAQDSYKLYTSAPWDIDSGTVGFKFRACPSVIYWEAVSRNRSMNREFASVFGFSSNGQVLYTNPVTEFTKKQRQLLLSKQVNTVMWNTQNQTWNMNDCYTMTSENHILNEDGNSRLFIRINKAIPTLLRPLIGRKLNNATYADAETILKYWFERTILTMQYSVSDYKVTIANLEANDDQARRQNKMYVLVECLFARSLKYVIVYSDALDMGMEFVGEIV